MSWRPLRIFVALAVPVAVAHTQDPDLKPGFPIHVFHDGGSPLGGQGLHTLVGNIDGDPQLEILRTGLTGPLYAWNYDGTPAAGWPRLGGPGLAFPVLGELRTGAAPLEVASANIWSPSRLSAWSGDGVALPGWPLPIANFVSSPPAAFDIDGNGIDELFLGEEDWKLHAYRADGTTLPGWPVFEGVGGQRRSTPCFADLDGDLDVEVLAGTETMNGVGSLVAYHHNGTPVAGFPVEIDQGVLAYPVVGDVDGDGAMEIVILGRISSPPWHPKLLIINTNGTVERTVVLPCDLGYGGVPALADLNNDNVPEIVVQADDALYAVRGDGSVMPGFPVTWTGYSVGNSAPVVGDVTGDGQPDILITLHVAGSNQFGEVRLYSATGVLRPRFPKLLNIAGGAVPAIADIDLDGRNDIIVSGEYWSGNPSTYPMVWAYNVATGNTGPVHWGQFMGGQKHNGIYVPVILGPFKPVGFVITHGTVIQGQLASLFQSDDIRLVIKPDFSLGRNDAPVDFFSVHVAPRDITPDKIEMLVEANTGSGGVIQTLYLYDFVQSSWVQVHSGQATSTDSLVTASTSANVTRFVHPNSRAIHARVAWFPSPTASRSWRANVDYMAVKITRK